MWAGQTEGWTHRRAATARTAAVEIELVEAARVHAARAQAAPALVRLALLLQHHAPPLGPGVLEPHLGSIGEVSVSVVGELAGLEY